MKKVLKNTAKNLKYLMSLPTIYLVCKWSKYTYLKFYFSGKFEKVKTYGDKPVYIPLVYDYIDSNGARDSWVLKRITHTTSGQQICWTQFEHQAQFLVKTLRGEK